MLEKLQDVLMTGGRMDTRRLNHRIRHNLVWGSDRLILGNINIISFLHLIISTRENEGRVRQSTRTNYECTVWDATDSRNSKAYQGDRLLIEVGKFVNISLF